MFRKIFTAALSLLLSATVMPAQILAEETGETPETYEAYNIVDEYTIEVICHANGGLFDPAGTDGVSDDKKTRTYEIDVMVYEPEDDLEGDIYRYRIEDEPSTAGLGRNGYVFAGWYTDKEGTAKLETDSSGFFPDEFHVYAKWFKTGWKKTGEGWMYIVSETDYYTDGIYEIGGKKYGFDLNGIMVTGWYKFSGKWHYFRPSGAMVTGWKKIANKWYWFDADGIMVKGWKKISGKWFYFKGSGEMVRGWQKIGGKWYFFQASGAMKKSWMKLSGKWYYFKSSGEMVTGTRKIGSKTYTFDSSGVCLNP
ncbi:MAG: hypothetical protein K6G61_11785 [Solobacterium sp.]|nr:hypothetical protein [Solobacterium sp.]